MSEANEVSRKGGVLGSGVLGGKPGVLVKNFIYIVGYIQ